VGRQADDDWLTVDAVERQYQRLVCRSPQGTELLVHSVPSRRRISGSAEFWAAGENPPKKCGRRKRRRILESRSAVEKNLTE